MTRRVSTILASLLAFTASGCPDDGEPVPRDAGADADADADSDADTDAGGDGDGDADAGPREEVCNGRDDDRDGDVDESDPGAGVLCDTDLVPPCGIGWTGCQGGALVCVPNVAPTPERCDNPGADDDCDGVPDDVTEVGAPCDTGLEGVCGAGSGTCEGEAFVCAPGVAPGVEWCDDGLDQDCDGETDEAGCRSPPAWGPCVNRTIDYFSCESYCTFVGQSCTASCTTTRGFAGWASEAFTEGDACVGMGEGQTPCDFAWDDDVGDLPRWRCCCE